MPFGNSWSFVEPLSRRDFARIARRFNAGNKIAKELSPVGTTEPAIVRIKISRPFGTWVASNFVPALKRRAILTMSLWD